MPILVGKAILEIYKAKPNAIISRRTLNALIQIDIIEISDNYMFKDPKLFQKMPAFSQVAGGSLNLHPEHLYDMLTWPIRARRTSFEELTFGTSFRVGQFGVNNVFQKQYKFNGKNHDFEFFTSAQSIHITNALNATYFPVDNGGYSEYSYAQTMGGMLNTYKRYRIGSSQSEIQAEEEKPKHNLNPIDIIKVLDYPPITEVENVLNYSAIFPKGKRLMETLAALTPMERQAKIEEYNTLVSKKIKPGFFKALFSVGESLALDLVSTKLGISTLGSMYTLLNVSGITKNLSALKPILDKIDDAIHKNDNDDKSNIHFLSQINRVARLRDRSEKGE